MRGLGRAWPTSLNIQLNNQKLQDQEQLTRVSFINPFPPPSVRLYISVQWCECNRKAMLMLVSIETTRISTTVALAIELLQSSTLSGISLLSDIG